jgi:uncharacterized protein YjbI with pentapeptide repeats
MSRKSFDDSVRTLRELGVLAADESIRIPDRMPKYDDEDVCGLSFFRTEVAELQINDLAIPRTFFGRSEIVRCSFRGSDLTESNLSWNDFIDVDFSDALLVGSDLRASNYERVNFTRADLGGADLRRSAFVDCIFLQATMNGAKLTRTAANELRLSPAQLECVDWQDTDGEEPGGG